MNFRSQVTGTTYGKSSYPQYDAADVGFRGYWYPAMSSANLRSKPKRLVLCGDEIVFIRDQGQVFALQDRCPHRGIPLSHGRREFPGTISCVYHGWTFDLKSGVLKGALTDGPQSPLLTGKPACVKTYPVQELAGLLWVYIGDGEEPPPLEEHVPEELTLPGVSPVSRITPDRAGDWRHGVENGYDEGHAKYLHRTAPWTLLRYLPAWTTVENIREGPWLTRRVTSVGWRSDYPGLGPWPAERPWWKLTWGPFVRNVQIKVRMPGFLRVYYVGHWWVHYEWYVPTETGRHRYVQITVPVNNTAPYRMFLQVWYWIYLRWMFHIGLFFQDDWMIREMRTPPEQLYRPDISIVGWRRHADQAAKERQDSLQAQTGRAASPEGAGDSGGNAGRNTDGSRSTELAPGD